MAPKTKITKEDIVNTAFSVVKEKGAVALNARIVAAELDCSTQPIFSNFENMAKLRLEVCLKAERLFDEYMQKEIESGEFPPYKASGMAYIRFAKEEKELFKLLYMCDRSHGSMPENAELGVKVEALVHDSTGLSDDSAKLFHLEMWAFVHGIATMFATDYLDLDRELVSKMITDCYRGLKKQYGLEI